MKSLAWRIKSFDQVRAMETAELERLLPEYEIEAANLSAMIKSGEVGAELAARAGKALGALKVCARWIKRELEHRLISSLAESQMARIRQSAEAKLSASTALPTTTDPLADLKVQNAEQAQRIADLEAEVERITEAGRAHIRRAAAFEAQRDDLAAWKAKIEAQPPVAWVRYRSDGGIQGPLLDAQVEPVRRAFWTPLIAAEWANRDARQTPAAAPVQAQPKACRDDGRCQYAIDHGAEGLGHCPPGKCVMPCEGGADAGVVRDAEPLFLLHCGTPFGGEIGDWEVEANSQRAVDELTARNPGETLRLYALTPDEVATVLRSRARPEGGAA